MKTSSLAVLAASVLAAPIAGAAATITAITVQTSDVADTAATRLGAGDNTFLFDATKTFNLAFSGERRTVTGYTANGVSHQIIPITYSIKLRRNSVGPTKNVVWYAASGSNPALPVANGGTAAAQTYNVNLRASETKTMEAAFAVGSLNVGTDNLFTNTGDSNGNFNNIERLDVVFSSALTTNSTLNFSLFERGTTAGHDGFKIAAITSVDSNGNPTSYGALYSVATGSWGTTDLGTLNTLVLRNADGSPSTDANQPSAYVEQSLGGISISAMGDLGLANGTSMYGYSIFGTDVTGANNLLNPNGFPTTTDQLAGGLDILGSFHAYTAVPEPGSFVIVCSSGLIALFRRRRRD